MKKVLFGFLIISLMIIPINAKEKTETIVNNEKLELLSSTEKYYKTITYNNNLTILNNLNNNNSNSITYEITKEEYNSESNIQPYIVGVETEYKKLTSQILQNGNLFRYKAILTWKTMPKRRSYDIIGIGFYNNVKPLISPTFSLSYCFTNGSCNTSSAHNPQIFSNGAGTSFGLPSGDLKSLSATFFLDITKTNSSTTITNQIAAADYSHATSSVSLSQSKKYSVNANGIALNGVSDYYDGISTATALWNGNW